jgi:transposase-like protein
MSNETTATDEIRTLDEYLESHKRANTRFTEAEKRRIVARLNEPGMFIKALAWIEGIPPNYIYRFKKQLEGKEV